jgi:hypothetical protein
VSSNNGNAGGKDRNNDNERGLHRCIFSDVLWAAKIFACDIPLSMTEIPFGLIVIAPQRTAPHRTGGRIQRRGAGRTLSGRHLGSDAGASTPLIWCSAIAVLG